MCAAGSATAQGPVRSVDEAAFVAAVEAADPRVAALAAEVEAARAAVSLEGVRPNPSVSLDREEVFPDGGSVPTSYARLTWPVQLSGQRGRRVAAARAAADAVAADAQARRFGLVVAGLRTFTEAAYARLRLELLRGERDMLVRAVDVLRKRSGAGASSGYDLQRFELELAAYDDLVVSAEIELDDLRTQLAVAAGAPGERLDAASEPDSDLLAGRADVTAARLRARSAEQRAAAAGRGKIPELAISGGMMSADTGRGNALGYTLGLSFTLPVLDRGGAATAKARADRRVAEAEARVLESSVPTIVRARRDTLRRRIAQAETLTAGRLARLDALLRSAETGYREGEGSVVELLDAYQTARDTRLRDLELRRDARLAELDLWQALGRRP